MRFLRLISVHFAFVLFGIFLACKPEINNEKPADILFSGFVVDFTDNPIIANLTINGENIKVNKSGEFKVVVKPADRYILNIEARGYAPISKIYFMSAPAIKYKLKKTTTIVVNPAANILVTDNSSECETIPALTEDELLRLKETTPVLDHTGKVTGFGIPDDLFQQMKAYQDRTICNTGASVSIPANALQVPQGTEKVEVSISTIDIFSRDGMPGDWSVAGEERRFMQSFGAASITVELEGRPVQLKKGEFAEIIIPVDPLVFGSVKEIPKSIPFLYYNKKTGLWEEEGIAKFDPEKMAFIGKTSHFSEFNMDIFKTDPSCVRFCLDPTLEDPANIPDQMEIIIVDQDNGMLVTRTKAYTSPGTCLTGDYSGQFSGCGSALNLLYNLSNNEPLLLKMTKGGSLVSMAVIQTGDPASNLNSNNSVDCPYDDCYTIDNSYVDPCTGSGAVIMKPIASNTPALSSATDLSACTTSLTWHDPVAAGEPFDAGNFLIESSMDGTNWNTITAVISEIRAGLYTTDLSFNDTAGTGDLDCFNFYLIRVTYLNNPTPSNSTCIDLLTGCGSCI